ncbi:MAG: type II toxin-antitoxin system RelB/DinJ family antitoxin [Acetobacteraceae bacterium]|nr:type II toxin-antitoxin system RelB/DinJ family antitoxin [Acetobacteraceae bacterium]MBV9777570.1 type II toxin-antitoxin system RelB/DinJ family antitoxin [Acetobacteraceae bacterium]
MPSDTVVRARIAGNVKQEAARVLEQMGLSVSDAIRLLLVRIAREKALPFEVKVPNDETIAAMEEARRGKGRKYRSVGEMMKDLNADDSAG